MFSQSEHDTGAGTGPTSLSLHAATLYTDVQTTVLYCSGGPSLGNKCDIWEKRKEKEEAGPLQTRNILSGPEGVRGGIVVLCNISLIAGQKSIILFR